MTKLKEGDPAPDFEGINEKEEMVSLSDFKGQKLILFFYPKDMTGGCTKEVCNLRDNYSQLTAMGFEILGISPDGIESHLKFIAKENLPFSLIADTEKKILKDYQVWGMKKFMGREYMGVLRTTFVIDENGNIEKIFRKVKTTEHAEQILSELNLS